MNKHSAAVEKRDVKINTFSVTRPPIDARITHVNYVRKKNPKRSSINFR